MGPDILQSTSTYLASNDSNDQLEVPKDSNNKIPTYIMSLPYMSRIKEILVLAFDNVPNNVLSESPIQNYYAHVSDSFISTMAVKQSYDDST